MKNKLDLSSRVLYDSNADKYLPPPLKDNRANFRNKNLIYIPSSPLGWFIVGNIIIATPTLVITIVRITSLPINIKLSFLSLILSFFVFGSFRIESFITRRVFLLGIFSGLCFALVQSHFEVLSFLKLVYGRFSEFNII